MCQHSESKRPVVKDKEQSVPILEIYIPTEWQINHIFSQIKEMSIILYVRTELQVTPQSHLAAKIVC